MVASSPETLPDSHQLKLCELGVSCINNSRRFYRYEDSDATWRFAESRGGPERQLAEHEEQRKPSNNGSKVGPKLTVALEGLVAPETVDAVEVLRGEGRGDNIPPSLEHVLTSE